MIIKQRERITTFHVEAGSYALLKSGIVLIRFDQVGSTHSPTKFAHVTSLAAANSAILPSEADVSFLVVDGPSKKSSTAVTARRFKVVTENVVTTNGTRRLRCFIHLGTVALLLLRGRRRNRRVKRRVPGIHLEGEVSSHKSTKFSKDWEEMPNANLFTLPTV